MNDLAASLRARLTNYAKEHDEPLQRVLQRYANERILYRLSQSQYRDEFILKGASLFSIWMDAPHRSTKDIDFLGLKSPDEFHLKEIFSEILGEGAAHEDGLEFDLKKLRIAPIREEQRYGGLRAVTTVTLSRARLPVQIDIGFGDAVQYEEQTIRTLLGQPAPTLKTYSKVHVIAEKVEAMVQLGALNSRMKDFYDICTLAHHFEFSGTTLAAGIAETFLRRGTKIPKQGLSDLFEILRGRSEKPMQWTGFIRKSDALTRLSFDESLSQISAFVDEPLQAAATTTPFEKHWSPAGPWLEKDRP